MGGRQLKIVTGTRHRAAWPTVIVALPLTLALAPSAFLGAACSSNGSVGSSDTLPVGWTGAKNLPIQQSACNNDDLTAMAAIDITDAGGSLAVAIKDVEFRCNQQICGYSLDVAATTRVLLQPCDLHPTTVTRCDCMYDMTLTLPPRSDRVEVSVYRRTDYYGAMTTPNPQLVADTRVGPKALLWYQTCGAPRCNPGDADAGGGVTDGGAPGCTPIQQYGSPCLIRGTTCDPRLYGCGILLLCTDQDPTAQPGGCPL